MRMIIVMLKHAAILQGTVSHKIIATREETRR